MRLLQVVPTSGAGGAERIVLSLSEALTGSGTEVIVASSGREPFLFDELARLGIPAVALKSDGRRSMIREIAGLIRKLRPDVVHSHMFDANLPAALAGLLCRAPVILTVHSTVYELETRRRRLVNALLSRCAYRLAAVSRSVASALSAAGALARRITCVPNGVDVSRFLRPHNSGFRRELGVADSDQLVGMVANLRPAKDHELLIRAAASVVEQLPGAHFALVGDGVDGTATSLVSLVSQMGLEHRVHLAGFRQDMPDVLGSLDLFVLASKVEGLPVSVIEAMAGGLPVVASNVGGMDELIDEGVTGYLVPPGDRDSLARRITDLLSAREMAAGFGRAGRQKAVRCFSLEAMTGAYQRLYAECLGT